MTQLITKTLSDEILNKTMMLFWEKGYFNTSIEDIILATELNRSAIYKYFGGKDELFLAMLKRFRSNVTDIVTIPLQNKKNGMDGIKLFFTQFLELYDAKILKSRGCFLISTAIDIHSHNKEVAQFIERFLEDLRGYFRESLLKSKSELLLKKDIEITSVSDFLVGNLFGLMTLCRSSAPKQVFENHVSGIVNFISGLSTN